MNVFMTKLFSPLLNFFEKGEEKYAYRESHRKILVVVGLLFLVLSGGSLYVVLASGEMGGLIPVVGFSLAGIVCEIVGLLGSDKAVANMWKTK